MHVMHLKVLLSIVFARAAGESYSDEGQGRGKLDSSDGVILYLALLFVSTTAALTTSASLVAATEL